MTKFQPSKKTTNNEKIVISIRTDIQKIEEIDKIANKIDISRNELINQCIEYALENIQFKKNDKND